MRSRSSVAIDILENENYLSEAVMRTYVHVHFYEYCKLRVGVRCGKRG